MWHHQEACAYLCVFVCVCVCGRCSLLKTPFLKVKPCKLWWVGGRTVDWLAGWCAFGSLPRCTNLPKKKKRQNLPSLSEPCLRPEASGGRLALRKLLLLCGALEMAPAVRPRRPSPPALGKYSGQAVANTFSVKKE